MCTYFDCLFWFGHFATIAETGLRLGTMTYFPHRLERGQIRTKLQWLNDHNEADLLKEKCPNNREPRKGCFGLVPILQHLSPEMALSDGNKLPTLFLVYLAKGQAPLESKVYNRKGRIPKYEVWISVFFKIVIVWEILIDHFAYNVTDSCPIYGLWA